LDGTNNYHALLWNGTAQSVVDLHAYLAGLPITFTDSTAGGITAGGVILGTARDGAHNSYAVMWIPIPEPTTCTLLAMAISIAIPRRSSRPRRMDNLSVNS
jgi:hypothetical protein